jgi:hypothetical protein
MLINYDNFIEIKNFNKVKEFTEVDNDKDRQIK